MKTNQIILIAIVCAGAMSLAGCIANPNATPSENAAAAWNAPATQQEVAVLTQIGTSALNAWVSSQVTKGRHENKEQFVAEQTELAAKQHPGIPRAKIRATIKAKLAEK